MRQLHSIQMRGTQLALDIVFLVTQYFGAMCFRKYTPVIQTYDLNRYLFA